MNELSDAIANLLDLASQHIDDLDDDMMMALTELLNMASARLDQDESEPVGDIPNNSPPQDKMKMDRPFPSSNVHSFGYDDNTGKLLVKFQGDYPDQNGPVYGYEGVPKNIYNLFRQGAIPARTDGKNKWGEWWKGKQPSLGASLYTLIKEAGYNYQRLT